MANDSKIKHGELLPPLKRQVGVRIGDQVFLPALPADAELVRATNGYLADHTLAVSLLDQYYLRREQYAANRSLIWRPAVDIAAQEEEELELKHRRQVAHLRREKELHEHKLAAMQAQHKLEAEEEFKPLKFATGAARFAEKTAKFRVGEAVANASMLGREPETEEPPTEKGARTPMVEALLQGIEDLEKEIEEREASGQDAASLHVQRDALRELVLRALKRAP